MSRVATEKSGLDNEGLKSAGGGSRLHRSPPEHQYLCLARSHRPALLSFTSTRSSKRAMSLDSPANIPNPNNMISHPTPGTGTVTDTTPPSSKIRIPTTMRATAVGLNLPLLL